MIQMSLSCPKCNEVDLQFQIERDSAEDGYWFNAGMITDEQECDCQFTDVEIITLESDAGELYRRRVEAD